VVDPLLDPETGFQYDNARYYDPATNQFTTEDPLQALTQQTYAYAGDNPINNTDPTGQNAFSSGQQGSCVPGSSDYPHCTDGGPSFELVAELTGGGLCLASVIGTPECVTLAGLFFAAKTYATASNSCLSTGQKVVGIAVDALASAPGWSGLAGEGLGGLESGIGKVAVNTLAGTVGAAGLLGEPALIKKAGEDSGSPPSCGCS
jgi:RHS repeat-associated protein